MGSCTPAVVQGIYDAAFKNSSLIGLILLILTGKSARPTCPARLMVAATAGSSGLEQEDGSAAKRARLEKEIGPSKLSGTCTQPPGAQGVLEDSPYYAASASARVWGHDCVVPVCKAQDICS